MLNRVLIVVVLVIFFYALFLAVGLLPTLILAVAIAILLAPQWRR